MTNEITPVVAIVCAAVCFLVGGFLLRWGLGLLAGNRRAERAGVRVTGTVVAHATTIDSDDTAIHHAIFEFTTTAGEIVRVQSSSGTTDFLKAAVGTKVPVSYDPQRPENARIVGSDVLPAIILCVLGAGFCAAGVLALVAGFLLPH